MILLAHFQSSPRRISRTTKMRRTSQPFASLESPIICYLLYQCDTTQTSTAFFKHCESEYLVTKCETPLYKIQVLSQATISVLIFHLYLQSNIYKLAVLQNHQIEYRSDDVTKIYFWNFKILTMWSERAPYNRHTSKVSDK